MKRTLAHLLQALERDAVEYSLQKSGSAWMVVAPALAARILGAGADEENLLWTADSFSTGGWAAGGNAGGARTWIAPEGGSRGFFCPPDLSQWGVPLEIDPGSYSPCAGPPGSLAYRSIVTARAADGARFDLEITRCMRLEKGTGGEGGPAGQPRARIIFSHEIRNAGGEPVDRRAGLWFIAQVPSETPGTIVIPARPGSAPNLVRPYFADMPEGILRTRDDTVMLRALGGLKYKLGVRASRCAGSISFLRPSAQQGPGGVDRWTLVSLRFPLDPRGEYLDKPWYDRWAVEGEGDAVQAYNDPGTGEQAFSEIEVHAPAVRLEPGQGQAFEIEISLACGSREELLRLLETETGARPTPSDLSW